MNYTYRESGEKSEAADYLGRASNEASYAGTPANDYYVVYLPNQKGANLNLRVNYTLESIDGSGETIVVRGATAQVPLIYAQWKPGYAYTYLFKISDKTNGHTTDVYDPTHPEDTYYSDPAGLYPITFDAVVVNAEKDNTQETITTVSAPSITTYQKGSNVINQNEYKSGSTYPIFVTVNEGTETPDLPNGKVVDLAASGNKSATLYTLPDDKVYTEADVVDAMQMQDDDAAVGTVKGRSGLVLTKVTTPEPELVSSIQYGADGNAIDLNALPKPASEGVGTYTAKAMKFTPTANTTYAFVYTKTAASGTATKIYQPKTFADDANVYGYYRYALIQATTPVDNSHTGDVEKGKTYFNAENPTTGAISAFLGQTVDNLFEKTGSTGTNADYTPARGYAQTGTPYYYTLDNGKTYIATHPVAYADFTSTTLYKNNTGATVNSDTKPEPGQAYYFKNSSDEFEYCVIYPQRTDGLWVIKGKETTVAGNVIACTSAEKAVSGMVYFDMYTQNNGVYYVKIIKVE